MSIEYRFQLSEDYLAEAIARHSKQLWWYRLGNLIVLILSLPFIVMAVRYLYLKQFTLAFTIIGILAAVVLAKPFEMWIAKRRFRKSPYYNDNTLMILSDAGVMATGQTYESHNKWEAFTKARRFSDGLMLFQGPGIFNWLPDKAGTVATASAAQALVRTKVVDYREV